MKGGMKGGMRMKGGMKVFPKVSLNSLGNKAVRHSKLCLSPARGKTRSDSNEFSLSGCMRWDSSSKVK